MWTIIKSYCFPVNHALLLKERKKVFFFLYWLSFLESIRGVVVTSRTGESPETTSSRKIWIPCTNLNWLEIFSGQSEAGKFNCFWNCFGKSKFSQRLSRSLYDLCLQLFRSWIFHVDWLPLGLRGWPSLRQYCVYRPLQVFLYEHQ